MFSILPFFFFFSFHNGRLGRSPRCPAGLLFSSNLLFLHFSSMFFVFFHLNKNLVASKKEAGRDAKHEENYFFAYQGTSESLLRVHGVRPYHLRQSNALLIWLPTNLLLNPFTLKNTNHKKCGNGPRWKTHQHARKLSILEYFRSLLPVYNRLASLVLCGLSTSAALM